MSYAAFKLNSIKPKIASYSGVEERLVDSGKLRTPLLCNIDIKRSLLFLAFYYGKVNFVVKHYMGKRVVNSGL